MKNMQAYYGQLVGFTITGVSFEEDDYMSDDFPVLMARNAATGEQVKITVSQDEEGNGGGFLFIEEDAA